ncbi:hypothetical protein ACIHDR_43520 [Nocardia sp. NPDC052278]|uniref:hypothetical protein n=1 Tax=unclassified Nocardia TaxID=2637762 RepID=UPI0036D0F1D8
MAEDIPKVIKLPDNFGETLSDALVAKKLLDATNEMIATLSSPAFVAAMKKLKKTSVDKRLEVASKILTPTALAAAGVKLPSGMRVTSRYFEQGDPDIIEVTSHGAALRHVGSIPALGGGAVGAWACACGGGVSICGGAGGGS